MYVYKLTSENLTHLGGPMGTEYTYPNWVRIFKTADAAKAAAEKDYKKEAPLGEKWKWIKEGTGFRSPDLRFVMYHIQKEKVEE